MQTITIDPVTRLEGHLKVEVVVDDGRVKEARTTGTLFRGIELILKGRHPLDAQRITQRVCGVCPASHAVASTLNLDSALGTADRIPPNGRILRNLVLGCNFVQSHILHFYHLAALDYVDVTAAADYEGDNPDLKSLRSFIERGALGPFVPRYEGDYRLNPEQNRLAALHYVQALRMRRLAHEALAIFGGKMPHNSTVMPGGCTERASLDKVAQFLGRINALREFIDNCYIPDILMVARAYPDYLEIGAGCRRYLAYGAFDLDCAETDLLKRPRFLASGLLDEGLNLSEVDAGQIAEEVKHSWYADDCAGHPTQGRTEPAPQKDGAYSWLKSPRYQGKPTEVGPLARILVNYQHGHEKVKALVDTVLSELGQGVEALRSTLGRHAARALETKLVADAMAEWVLELAPGEPTCTPFEIPAEGEGMGLVGAPRGALGHWMRIRDHAIDHYQMVVPTTWNGGPRDAKGQPGPIEQALEGTPVPDPENPFSVVRVVRSFDPCMACSVHLVNAKGSEIGRFRLL